MRNPLAVILLLLALCSSALAGPAEEATLVVERWAKAFTESDVDAIVNLYDSEAPFLGTGSKTVVTDPAEVRKYFEVALLNDRPRGAKVLAQNTVVVSDTVVVITGLDLVTGTRSGVLTNSYGRFTFVLARRTSGWKIAHFHRSAVPA